MTRVCIVGGGPAGSAAAISGLAEGARVEIIEKSRFPRHKVCGEFLSPEVEHVLRGLGVWNVFLAAGPARITGMILHFGSRSIAGVLPQPAFGLSRFALDSLLMDGAVLRGATLLREGGASSATRILATGRTTSAPRGKRIFGFKAHFRGEPSDAVELFFFDSCYVGLNTVEAGVTNVCGLAPEETLRRYGFDVDGLVNSSPALRERLAPLSRTMEWMHVGPLVFRNELKTSRDRRTYVCGDALSFVDPFTGSGLLSALITGEIAGRYAAQELPVSEYLSECRAALRRPFLISSAFRTIARRPFAGWLASAVPPEWLFRWTRPLTHS